MDRQEKYEYWLALAQEDLRTAEAMHGAGRWLYVAFCCQQAVEKAVKGLYIPSCVQKTATRHHARETRCIGPSGANAARLPRTPKRYGRNESSLRLLQQPGNLMLA
jgi:hypothetical protein